VGAGYLEFKYPHCLIDSSPTRHREKKILRATAQIGTGPCFSANHAAIERHNVEACLVPLGVAVARPLARPVVILLETWAG